MQSRQIWMLGLLALGALSCRSTEPAGDPARDPAPVQTAPRPADPAPAFADIEPGLDALRARFQEDDGMVRVIMLVAPT
jgi:hypothetical protein